MSQWPYNTTRWLRLRALVLSGEPTCRYCAELGHVTPATEVDHIRPVARDRSRAFEVANLQPLCESCHNGAKQREDISGRRIGAALNGDPLNGWPCPEFHGRVTS